MLVEGTAKPAQAAGMSSSIQSDWSALLPTVALDVRQNGGRPATYALDQVDFLVGTIPGCDLRLGGTEAPALLCLLARHPEGVTLRKLVPSQIVLVNGRSAFHLELAHDDRIQIGSIEIRLRITPPAQTNVTSAPLEQQRRELHDRVQAFREQLVDFHHEKEQFERQRQELLSQASLERQTPAHSVETSSANALDTAELEARERQLDERLEQYEADVLRLDRWQGTLEQREMELATANEEANRQRESLARDSAELEEQLRQVDEWRANLADEAERIEADKKEHDARGRDVANRVAVSEGQQATLSALRGRLERMREEMRARQQELDAQKETQDERELEIARRMKELERIQAETESQQEQHERDRQTWLERGAVIEAAVHQMKNARAKLALDEEQVKRTGEENDLQAARLAEAESVLQGRLEQLAETRERLDLELNALRERSVNLLQREQACETLQEQLRRRAEELDERRAELTEQVEAHQVKVDELEELQRQFSLRDEEAKRQIDNWRQDLEAKAVQLARQHEELAGFEERYQEQLNQIAIERRLLAEEQGHFQLEQRAKLDILARERSAFETMKAEADELVRQLPDAELRAATALDRLTHAREQMREHLQEINRYVKQSRAEVEQVRGRLQADLDELHVDEETLRRGQDEHRLAMAAFRQQLIDWQGQVAELRRLLARDENRLERKKAQADERAKEMEAESQRLTRQAEEIEEHGRVVADRRHEMDRHLVEMRDWYRHKLRDLAGVPMVPEVPEIAGDDADVPASPAIAPEEDGEAAIVPVGRSILSLSGSSDPGDLKLGEVLRDSQLVDPDSLLALLAEARRQRRSLRQVLLASGVITLYQLALIEAGDLGGLVLGPVRVVDRLRHSALETAYRVYDPRRGTEAVLRHLSEAASTDPLHVEDFRRRFDQARLNNPHLANTLEVFDLLGRPAVLQEWLVGLPATDWPPLTAAPGVCYRLLSQAAQGLAAAHEAGVVHGRLSDSLLLLTESGVLKIAGIGDPPWLVGVSQDEEPTARDDLRMLGTLVSGWCTPSGVRKGAKTKPLPDTLVSVLYRLAAEGGAGYHDVGEFLLDLEKASSDIPPNAEAWDRLLKYVREHGATESMIRQSA